MGVRAVHELLARYRSLTPPHASVRRVVCEAVEEVCGIPLTPKQVRIYRRTAVVSLVGAARAEVRLRRGEVLQRVRERLPTASLEDIR